ncbi:3-deoxy-D-manno-octulosonic acid transferase [Paracoccus zhejiangensis]|uniref:3-deoxy-D-manno-octulosonic acid transferase n=1 Tax=Paracoccus zhejiangensis TaxID=1077935 RepID=A0A2H5F299_9RHOB|nr:glycosyltransferase N-terminal domain-containing protein [Paracoccus zhejiangensis]AUH65653.1 3-deoxy-D-manno-octulosonic acid transferase [Paracoccus zhejiangensis]
MSRSSLGSLGLWLELRRKRGVRLQNLSLPPGKGPLLILRSTPDAAAAADQVVAAMRKATPDLRILFLGRDGLPDVADDPVAAPQLLAEAQPRAILLLGDDLPAALISAAEAGATPLVLGQIAIREKPIWGLERSLQRHLLEPAEVICVTDEASRKAALGMGLPAARIRLTGPVTEIRDPLPGFEGERMTLAAMLRGRHVWLATALPVAEEEAVFQAHLAALRHSHKALLVVNPADPAVADAMADRFEAGGLVVARRNADEDPTTEVQVQFAEDAQELGLWYRLAPLCYMGGTLSEDDAAARHPFEPASLGSAIMHGPQIGRYEVVWRQLDGAGATRRLRDAGDLAAAVTQLSQAQQVATLAANAWAVSTGGAGVALEIARSVLNLLKGIKA